MLFWGSPPGGQRCGETQRGSGGRYGVDVDHRGSFLPVVFIQEEAGQLFRDIALAISAAVGLSMLFSVTVICTASARFFASEADGRRHGGRTDPHRSPFWSDCLGPGRLVRRLIVRFNRWIQLGFFRRLAGVLLLVGVSVGFSYKFWPRVEYLRRATATGFFHPDAAPGYNVTR
ncbi:MAG: hypothetical protein Ct9H300mP1_35490 [Planctomycetaceae bacterium]|nr:MAG: hypothetical protein Ct9H300mP1_35490 [Planctomycetaceae bacterium]